MKIIVSVVTLCMIAASNIWAYDNADTHPRISGKAIQYSNVGTYVKQYLGSEFAKGSDTLLNGLMVSDWLSKGSVEEDVPDCRASNHFHNPLQPWGQSYMSDDTTPLGLGVRLYCELQGWSYFGRKSDVTWATGFLASAPSGTKGSFISSPDYAPYNWDKAHTDYYNALTSITTAERESKFADTFGTLGHIMYLLQDMAVPSHTRNDFQLSGGRI